MRPCSRWTPCECVGTCVERVIFLPGNVFASIIHFDKVKTFALRTVWHFVKIFVNTSNRCQLSLHLMLKMLAFAKIGEKLN